MSSNQQGAPGAATSSGSVNDADGIPRRHPAATAKAQREALQLRVATQPPGSVSIHSGGIPEVTPAPRAEGLRFEASSHAVNARETPSGHRVEVVTARGEPVQISEAGEDAIVRVYSPSGKLLQADPVSSLRLVGHVVDDERGRPGFAPGIGLD